MTKKKRATEVEEEIERDPERHKSEERKRENVN